MSGAPASQPSSISIGAELELELEDEDSELLELELLDTRLDEELSEEELAVFDLITRPDMQLSEAQTREVKRIARDLLVTLKSEKLVLDWRKRQQSRAAVQVAVKTAIWQLPESFSDTVCQQKSALVYQHVYDNYWGAWSARQSVYAQAA